MLYLILTEWIVYRLVNIIILMIIVYALLKYWESDLLENIVYDFYFAKC